MRKNIACIDLGSNSCRVCIADADGKILYKDAKATKLGEGIFQTGLLSQGSFERSLNAFDEFAKQMKKYEVGKYRAVATEACRRASNADKFCAMIKDKTNIELEIIEPLEEARLNLKGAILHAKGFDYAVVYDLGGASTEITLARNTQKTDILHTISIPWGARNAAEAYALEEFSPQNAIKLRNDIMAYVEDFIKSSELEKYKKDSCLIAISSTPLRLCSMVKKQEKYEREKNDGEVMNKTDIDAVVQKVCAMNIQERTNSPYIGENRAPVFVAAAVIFKAIFTTLNFDNVIVSYKGALDAMIEELCHG
ncbi:MAG: hypothetical protein J5896_04820 [Alphaproteobacteria bacterium]|nr:hypothetical protein [Alphaproteobacteria bacterium]